MNKPLKYTLIGLGSVAILAAGAVAILAATFDPNKYKPEIERIAKDKTGRTLKLAGNLQLAFWPSIGARVAGVTLSEKGSDREFVSLESAHVSLKLMPLLHGEAIVDALHLTGLKAVVIKEKDGKFNFDDLVAAADAKKPAAKAEPRADGKLEFSGQAKGRNPDIDAKIQLSGNYKVDLPAKAFELAKLDARITGNAAGFQNLSATAKGDVAA